MLDRQTIRQTLVELDEGQKLREDLGLDSVDVVSIVSQIERRFRIRFSQQELDPQVLVTVRDVLNLMEVKLAEVPASQSSAA
jgi:acyl carrier protein